MKKQSQNNIY